MPEAALANLNKKAKSLSKPGQTYTIQDIQFTPSKAAIAKVRASLRNKIYMQAKAELANVNKLYPQQNYFLHEIDFGSFRIPALAARPTTLAVRSPRLANDSGMAVSQEINLSATVTLASSNSSKEKS